MGSEGTVKLLLGIADDAYSVIDAKSLYTTIEEAAAIAGVSYDTMSRWANSSVDPIPHIPVGKAKKLIRVAAISTYAQTKEVS